MVARVEQPVALVSGASLSGRSTAWNSQYRYSLIARCSASACPVQVCLDPLGAVGTRDGARKVENGNPLTPSAAAADCYDFIGLGEVDLFDRNRHAEHCGLERRRSFIMVNRRQRCSGSVVRIASPTNRPSRPFVVASGTIAGWAQLGAGIASRGTVEFPSGLFVVLDCRFLA